MDRFKEPTEPRVIHMCDECGGEIYECDDVTQFEDGDIVHRDCETEYVTRAFVWRRGTITVEGAIE